jgi:hypothetical protein
MKLFVQATMFGHWSAQIQTPCSWIVPEKNKWQLNPKNIRVHMDTSNNWQTNLRTVKFMYISREQRTNCPCQGKVYVKEKNISIWIHFTKKILTFFWRSEPLSLSPKLFVNNLSSSCSIKRRFCFKVSFIARTALKLLMMDRLICNVRTRHFLQN